MTYCAILTLALSALAMAACAPNLPRPFLEAKAAGHRAYGAGRYDEAAAKFRQAAQHAERIRDRDEALYLEAASYQRADRNRKAAAAYESLIALSPRGARAARSAYELAQFEINHGSKSRGWKMLHKFIKDYPQSGLARRALLRFLVHLDEDRGLEKTITYINESMKWYALHDLGEVALYQKALRLERLGRLTEARDTFVFCARTYPYPDGGLYDDSLFRASLLDEQLGNPQLAVQHLRDLLSVREPSTLNGTYERPRYSEAQMRLGTLHRDALGDPDGARKEFRKLFDSFKTSLLRDDALWAEAKIASDQDDKEGACEALTLLVKTFPESRYAPCAKLLCPDAPNVDARQKCRPYIAREIE
ncbi:MAG: hypothetical protein CSA75_00845 [Sorangium cellulosum]|nr:MAG: hypothetical protein CSA75_00845 [Sorangium cellulosum]